MLKGVGALDPDGDCSNLSTASSSTDEFVIGDSILAEEERLFVENERIAHEEEKKFSIDEELKENIEAKDDLLEKREAEIKEMRYKRLMHLLSNSKMYAVLLKNRIKEDEINARKKGLVNGTESFEESDLKNQNSFSQCNLGNILTEKNNGENNQLTINGENKSSDVKTSCPDFFKEVRVTNLGFTVSNQQPVLLEGGVMREYQLQGLKWMINLFKNGINGILADEMGLGKTIQVISFICYLIEIDIRGPFLVVAPLSTVSNWLSEFKRFAPKVPIVIYHGSKPERKVVLSKILQTSKVGHKTSHKVVITSYQIILNDKTVLGKINWYYIIIDEGHRLKNHNSMLSRALREFNTIGRLLLTGTPLQNNLSELWSLLNFLLPEVFSSLDVFESWFDIKELEKNGMRFMQEKFNIDVVNILQEILVPFLLRREKKDVIQQLPPKKEILIYCPITQHQKELYQATLDHSIEFLLRPTQDVLNTDEPLPKRRCFMNSPYGKSILKQDPDQIQQPKIESPATEVERFSTNIILGNPQMQLRKIVNHPYLIQYPLKPGTDELRVDEDIVRNSGKLLVLDALLAKLKNRGHKVVIFSSFKILLDILEDYALFRGYTYCRLDGDSKVADRDEQIGRFVTNPDTFLFLISIRAGGFGINLTAADTVIFYDSDWNPQVNLQCQDRCHRIGQTKPVVVYTLCAIGTVDERIIERGNAKRKLEKMILQKGKFSLNSRNSKKLNVMDLQELKNLLESTDHDAVINSNGFVLTDDQLEALLDRTFKDSDSTSGEDTENKVFKILN